TPARVAHRVSSLGVIPSAARDLLYGHRGQPSYEDGREDPSLTLGMTEELTLGMTDELEMTERLPSRLCPEPGSRAIFLLPNGVARQQARTPSEGDSTREILETLRHRRPGGHRVDRASRPHRAGRR